MTCDVVPFMGQAGVCRLCGSKLTGRQTAWCGNECRDEHTRHHDWNWARHAARKRDGGKCVRCGGTGERRTWVSLHPCDRRHAAAIRDLGIDPASISMRIRVARVLPWLEVNHIDPRNGGGYNWGCHNHLSNLETLCHGCHVAETTRQGRERRLTKKLATPGTLFEESA